MDKITEKQYDPAFAEKIEKSMPEGLHAAAQLVENWMNKNNVQEFGGLKLRFPRQSEFEMKIPFATKLEWENAWLKQQIVELKNSLNQYSQKPAKQYQSARPYPLE